MDRASPLHRGSALAGHVVLIGGGATSALTAVRLAERGFAVTVVEKAALGNGSSSRSNAGIRAQFGVESTVRGMMYAEWVYAHLHDWLQTPTEQRQPVIRQNGYLFLYEDPAQAAPAGQPAMRAGAASVWERAQRDAAMQRRIGLPVEVLAPAEVERRWPHLDASRLIGATYCATDGFLEPHVLLTEGYRRAREMGVQVCTRTEVLGATVRDSRIVRLETSAGPLEADWVVNATNAWAARVSQRIGGMPLPIAPLKRYLYHLRPGERVMDEETWARLPMTIYGLGPGRGAHSRPSGPQMVLAWAHETEPEPDFTDDDQDRIGPGFDSAAGIENYGYMALAQMADFAPRLAEVCGILATTSGYYGVTPDANPLIGYDAYLENLVHTAGFSGHGLMHAPLTARIVEALLTGEAAGGSVRLPTPFEAHMLDITPFDPSRDFRASAREHMVL